MHVEFIAFTAWFTDNFELHLLRFQSRFAGQLACFRLSAVVFLTCSIIVNSALQVLTAGIQKLAHDDPLGDKRFRCALSIANLGSRRDFLPPAYARAATSYCSVWSRSRARAQSSELVHRCGSARNKSFEDRQAAAPWLFERSGRENCERGHSRAMGSSYWH